MFENERRPYHPAMELSAWALIGCAIGAGAILWIDDLRKKASRG
jgi:hypothetical protein